MANDILGAIGSVFNKGCNEVGASFQRLHDNAVKDIEAIGKKTDEGGLLGGLFEAADAFSVGNMATETLSAFRVIPEDGPIKEGVSAGVNLLNGNLLVGLKDAAEAIGAAQTKPNATAQAPREAFTAEPPRERERAGRGVRTGNANDHFSAPTIGDMMGRDMREIVGDLGDILRSGGANETGNKEIDEEERKLLAEIQKILNTPGMMFEDMIFLLMRAVIKGTNKQAKALAGELAADGADFKKKKALADKDLAAANTNLAKAQATNDPVKIAEAQNQVMFAQSKVTEVSTDRTESRAEKFEALKQMLQKLSEMQQTLSNILNAQHESAMAAIRNIR